VIYSDRVRLLAWSTAIALLLVACGGDATSQPTYTLADGRAYSATDCPVAANLLIGGDDAKDGLPRRGQTDRTRVEEMLNDVRDRFIGPTDVVEVRVIPRNGEVWYRLDNGDVVVEQVEDYQFEFILSADGSCPPSPYSINGVPVLYSRSEA
jgi:hypothetical protein